jgi:hypothetical protein
MPTSLRIGPYRFFFYAGDRNEPLHIHVQHDNNEAKYWLSPIQLARNHGFSGPELRKIGKIVEENEHQLIESWNEFFNGTN